MEQITGKCAWSAQKQISGGDKCVRGDRGGTGLDGRGQPFDGGAHPPPPYLTALKPFIGKRYWHVFRGGRGQRALSKVVFYKKVCILDLWTVFFCCKLIYMLQNIWTLISHTNPSPIRKIPLFDWSEIDFVISNFVCQNVQTTVGGGGFQTKSERPNFLCPYLPNGEGAAEFWTMSKIW